MTVDERDQWECPRLLRAKVIEDHARRAAAALQEAQ
jgi:hypothetical protein